MFQELFNNLSLPNLTSSLVFKKIFELLSEYLDIVLGVTEKISSNFFITRNNVTDFAKERAVNRLKEEGEDQFFKRVKYLFSFMVQVHTKQGLEKLIFDMLGKKFTIRELFEEKFILNGKDEQLGVTTLLSGETGAYYFVVDFEDGLTTSEKFYVEDLIHLYKPAHVNFHIRAKISDTWVLEKTEYRLGVATYI